MYGSGRLPVKLFNIITFVVATWYTCWSYPSPTVPNLLPNVDECKKFEIHAHSSLSKGQMHKIIFFFSWAQLKVRK